MYLCDVIHVHLQKWFSFFWTVLLIPFIPFAIFMGNVTGNRNPKGRLFPLYIVICFPVWRHHQLCWEQDVCLSTSHSTRFIELYLSVSGLGCPSHTQRGVLRVHLLSVTEISSSHSRLKCWSNMWANTVQNISSTDKCALINLVNLFIKGQN